MPTNEDLVRALNGGSAAPLLQKYNVPQSQVHGLRSYLPELPDWMKTAMGAPGQAMGSLARFSPEAAMMLNFLMRRGPAMAPAGPRPNVAPHAEPVTPQSKAVATGAVPEGYDDLFKMLEGWEAKEAAAAPPRPMTALERAMATSQQRGLVPQK